MERKIRPDQVRLGMYVRGFGGSWFDHPFWRVKFVLKTHEDVERVRQSGVPFVVIDDALGVGPEDSADAPAAVVPQHCEAMRRPTVHKRHGGRPADYGETRRVAERREAVALVSRSKKVMRHVFDGARLGRAVRVSDVLPVVDEIARSVERGPRTLLDVIRLKNSDEYTYLHSVAVCTLMVNLARFMGRNELETKEYGLAGLLHDIGKMGIPEPVLHKAGRLTDAEFELVRTHPEYGFRLLSDTPNVSQMALDVCRHHHEKMNGTGYPFGLRSEAISEAARLGAICDVYDALTSDRAYKKAWSPAEAVGEMWSWKGHFDQALLFTFMQSVGVFPSRMLVRLRSNRLGIVLANKRRNSRPRVLCFYDTVARGFLPPEEIVIEDSLAGDGIVAPASPDEWGLDDWEGIAERLLAGMDMPMVA